MLYIYIVIYIYIYIYIVIYIVLASNLDEVLTYNHMDLMSLRIRSRVKASIVLTRGNHLCIHNYIRSLLNIILRPIVKVRTGLLTPYWLRPTEPHKQLYIYIYIYIYTLHYYYY